MNVKEFLLGSPQEREARVDIQELEERLAIEGRLSGLNRSRLKRARPLVQTLRRRQIAAVSATLGLSLLLLGAGVYAPNIPGSPDRTSSTSVLVRPDNDYIQQEISRLGIVQSKQEIDLWASAGVKSFSRADLKFWSLDEPTTKTLLDEKINKVIYDLMSRSKNPFIRDISEVIKQEISSGNLIINPRLEPLFLRQERYYMGMSHYIRGGKIVWSIEPTAQSVLHANAMDLALQFVHEGEHSKDFTEHFANLSPLLPIEAREQMFINQRNNSWVAKEARAYGVQSRAIIYNIGLTGAGVADERPLARLIACGNDLQSACFKDFVDVYFIKGIRG